MLFITLIFLISPLLFLQLLQLPLLTRLKFSAGGVTIGGAMGALQILSFLGFSNLSCFFSLVVYLSFLAKNLYFVPVFPSVLLLRVCLLEFVLCSPQILSHLGVLGGVGMDWMVREDLTDLSFSELKRREKSLKWYLNALKSYKSWQNDENLRILEHILARKVEVMEGGAKEFLIPSANMVPLYPLSCCSGMQEAIFENLCMSKWGAEDLENTKAYLRRLDKLETQIEQELISPSAFYTPGQVSSLRPGVFKVSLLVGRRGRRGEMKPLFLHEAIPGHHWQITGAQQQEGLPLFRQQAPWFTAYMEGWGLYAELLGEEIGAYKDKEEVVGQRLFALLRASRLVVDTGLHWGGWTREKGIRYLMEEAGLERQTAEVEVDRYLCMPGQACAYTLGLLHILRLRKEAEEALGADFDIRDFHAVVLRGGAMPLDLLEERVGEWVRRGGGS